MESLLLNFVTVGISSSIFPFLIWRMTSRELSKPVAIIVLILNGLVMTGLWVAVRNLVLTGQFEGGSSSGGRYINYGVVLATMAGWRLLLLPRPHRVVSKEKPKAIDDVCTQRETPNVERTGYLAPARKQRWPLTIWIASAIVGIGAGIFFLINLDARKQLAPYVLATELKPHDFRAWLALARECHGLKRYSQAEEACKTALKLHPDDSSAFLFLGRIYRDQGRMSEAIYCYSQAQDGYAYSELGDLYTKMGQFENANSRHGMAIAYWKRETESDHAFWLTWENLGDAYLKNEQRANARAAYETAVRLSPNTAHLREKLQKLGGAN